jgi:hypothetical protein
VKVVVAPTSTAAGLALAEHSNFAAAAVLVIGMTANKPKAQADARPRRHPRWRYPTDFGDGGAQNEHPYLDSFILYPQILTINWVDFDPTIAPGVALTLTAARLSGHSPGPDRYALSAAKLRVLEDSGASGGYSAGMFTQDICGSRNNLNRRQKPPSLTHFISLRRFLPIASRLRHSSGSPNPPSFFELARQQSPPLSPDGHRFLLIHSLTRVDEQTLKIP